MGTVFDDIVGLGFPIPGYAGAAENTVNLRAAETLFKLEPGYTAAQVKERFAEMAKASHPDTAAVGAAFDAAKLVAAKRLLLANCVGEIVCTQCKGRGSVRAKLSSVQCTRCKGTGHV